MTTSEDNLIIKTGETREQAIARIEQLVRKHIYSPAAWTYRSLAEHLVPKVSPKLIVLDQEQGGSWEVSCSNYKWYVEFASFNGVRHGVTEWKSIFDSGIHNCISTKDMIRVLELSVAK